MDDNRPCQERVVRFGPYTLDKERLVLRKRQLRLSLRRQAMQLLVLLVEHHDQLVSRKEIEAFLWEGGCPLNVDSQQRISWCIRLIRRALNDNTKAPRYIITGRGGYQFVGPVEPVSLPTEGVERNRRIAPIDGLKLDSKAPVADPTSRLLPETQTPGIVLHRRRRRKAFLTAASLFSLIAVVALLWFMPWEKHLQAQPLTTAPAERSPRTAAVSPDGKYLAFSDKTGTYLQVISSAQVYPILALKGFQVFHLAWFPDSAVIAVCAVPPTADLAALFVTPIFGAEPPRRLSNGVRRAVVSWKGDQIAWVSQNGTAIWIMGSTGDNARQLIQTNEGERITELAWAPDGKRLVVSKLKGDDYRYTIHLQAVEVESGRQTILLAESMLEGFAIAENGRLICSIGRSRGGAGLYQSMFHSTVDRQLQLRRVGGSEAPALYSLSITADGRRLCFLGGSYQADVYTAATDPDHTRLRDLQRLTMDDRNDFPTAWAAAGDAVIYHCERNGHYAIAEQRLNESGPRLIVMDSADSRSARATPDGQSLLYVARPTEWPRRLVGPARLMRVPMQGGPSQEVLTRFLPFDVRCSQFPSRLCVIMEHNPLRLVFSRLDPFLGTLEVVAREPVPFGWRTYHWDLSADGTMIALAFDDSSGGLIKTIDLRTGKRHTLHVDEYPVLQSLDWSPDGGGWYVSSPSADGAVLFFVRRTGETLKLRVDAIIDSHRSNRIVPGWQSRMSFDAETADLLCVG